MRFDGIVWLIGYLRIRFSSQITCKWAGCSRFTGLFKFPEEAANRSHARFNPVARPKVPWQSDRFQRGYRERANHPRVFALSVRRTSLNSRLPRWAQLSTPWPNPTFCIMAFRIHSSVPYVLLALAAVFSPIKGAGAATPNLILIIADDMSPEDSESYGGKTVRTPHLARLAREGLRFERGFVTTSSCSPSRASIATGRYPHETGASELHQPLPANQIVFPEKLREAGYWTGAAGKWHLGKPAQAKFDVVQEGGGPSGCENWIPMLRGRPAGQPFFLWLAALDPHRDYQANTIPQPHTAADVSVPPFLPDVPEVRADFARYYDEITRLDGYVGSVLDELERQGVAENTLILFISDNGRPFPRCKTTLYDSGIRSPWLVRWPAQVKPGMVSNRLVSTVDIAPTFLALAGAAALPDGSGQSFLPQLHDPTAPGRDYIYGERHWHDYGDFARAVRSERWKYIRNYFPDLPNQPPADAVRSPAFTTMRQLHAAGKLTAAQAVSFQAPRPREELYDLTADPHELRNLADDRNHQATLGQLRTALENFQKTTKDRVPDRVRPDEFHRVTGERLNAARKSAK